MSEATVVPLHIPDTVTWDVTDLFLTQELYDTAVKGVEAQLNHSEPIEASANGVYAALEKRTQLREQIGRIALYDLLRYYQDRDNPDRQRASATSNSLNTQVAAAGVSVDATILKLPAEVLNDMNQTGELQTYRHALDDLRRKESRMQSPDIEQELTFLEGKERQAATEQEYQNVHLQVRERTPLIANINGQLVAPTASLYNSTDRTVRAQAAAAIDTGLSGERERTALAAIYGDKVTQNNRAAALRRFSSSLEATLFRDNIPVSVYTELVKAVHIKGIPLLRQYQELRRQVLGYDTLHMYDIVAPIISVPAGTVSFAEAATMANEALALLGPHFSGLIQQALDERWIHVITVPNKQEEARTEYAVGAPHPYVLLRASSDNINPYRFIHEVGGHAGHFHASKDNPTDYVKPDVFTGEAVAMCNEQLLTEYRLAHATNNEERAAILAEWLDISHRAFFRQTMFAEFEQRAHQLAQEGQILNAETLDGLYQTVNIEYYGATTAADSQFRSEWGRLGNLYAQPSHYVFQYATGMAVAVALCEQMLREGEPAIARYAKLREAGSSDYSINLLRQAGVDMTTPEPTQEVLTLFEKRMAELRTLLLK